jgi:2-keto-4-pentenoate hydratase/2-oxohepta-3-ene-1,7-dioic acid hydratase in catechol pathway
MRIVRFTRDACPLCHRDTFWGALDGQEIELLAGPPYDGVVRTGDTVPLADVRLLAPVDPPNLVGIGLNYRGHAAEAQMAIPERPLMFLKATTCIIANGETIVLPALTPGEVDYEAELCVVIGKTARFVAPEDALDHVFGYTCGNDVSARDCQLVYDKQWARGKSYETFAPLGPWIETDLDPDSAPISARLNGETLQDSNTSDLIFPCAEIISFLSQVMTLLPGTVIMTGTPAGVGYTRQPPVYLRPGDVIEVEIGGIGVLRNTVAAAE